MPSQILLSDAQRLEFTSVPETITDDELEYFYSLREEDIEIANAHRGDENKLGFALNICTLRHKGWPYNVLSFVAPKVNEGHLASHNPHYGSAKGVTLYRHTSDEYSTFYINVINTNIRDAVHVIDGVLHHESELEFRKVSSNALIVHF